MNHSFDPIHDSEAPRDDVLLRKLLAELAEGRESAPDLTDAVMGRLGFVRCTAAEARGARRRCLLQRAAMLLLAVGAAFGGYLIASQRSTSEPTMALMPAVGVVVERQGRSLEVLFEGMPKLNPGEVNGPISIRYANSMIGPVPILLIPAPVRAGSPCEVPEFECPTLRRAAAAVPFPET